MFGGFEGFRDADEGFRALVSTRLDKPPVGLLDTVLVVADDRVYKFTGVNTCRKSRQVPEQIPRSSTLNPELVSADFQLIRQSWEPCKFKVPSPKLTLPYSNPEAASSWQKEFHETALCRGQRLYSPDARGVHGELTDGNQKLLVVYGAIWFGAW